MKDVTMDHFYSSLLSALGAVLLSASSATANDYCEDLWFTRNAIMDRAGYCFGSPLGQAIFDNSDCLGKSVSLSSDDQKRVTELQRLEQQEHCRVNTAKRHLSLDDLGLRKDLWHLPLRDLSGSACIGWLGPQVGLRIGHSQDAPIIGKISPGDTIGYNYLPEDGWDYVQVYDSNWSLKSAGWTDLAVSPKSCRDIAG
ncbi:hypothetical protein NBRC116598_09490 [Pseudophaeobacter arcticus]|uniref:YARHG domain-containing protein n=1 Tax=Pseudophaeobacter arcticus TaxID=385492 RepID=A0ABQ0AI32_9RHOB